MKMRVLHIQNYWSIHFYGTSFFLIRSMTFILMSVSDSWIRFSVVRCAVRSLLAHSLLMLFFPEAGGPRIMTCGTGEKSIQCTFKSFAETQFYTYIIAHHPYSCMNVAVTISGSFLLLYIISIFSTPILIHELPDFHCSMFIDNSIPLKGINLRAHVLVIEIYSTYHRHFLFSAVPQEMPKGHLVCLQSIAPSTSINQSYFEF